MVRPVSIKNMTRTNSHLPTVSVIIPTPPGEVDCMSLKCLKTVDYPSDKIEVFIVEGRQPSKQRNEAAKIARGELIYFLDSDSEFSKNLFRLNTRHYKNSEVAAVGGPSLSPKNETFAQKCFGAGLKSLFGAFNTRARYKPIGAVRYATEKEVILCNLSIRTEIFKRYKGFDERLYPNEENEFLNRMTSNKEKIIYDPEVRVFRNHRDNLKQFIKQLLNYGRGRAEHYMVSPQFLNPVFFVPVFFICYVLSLFFFHPWWYKMPFYAYIILSLFFTGNTAVEERSPVLLFVMPFIFFLMHFSYGFGILTGLAKRIFNKKENSMITNINILNIKYFDSDYIL